MSFAETNPTPFVLTVLLDQDDPRKCSSRKLCRAGLARPLYRLKSIPKAAIVLNPKSQLCLLASDRNLVEKNGIVAIDCSWEKADIVFSVKLRGIQRRLPLLLPANPVKYAQLGVLSSAEALASGLYITGFMEGAFQVLRQFKWGPHFFTLNKAALDEYSQATDAGQLHSIETSFFGVGHRSGTG